MDARLREIAAGPAGTYFIVTDNSAATEFTMPSNLRLVPINVEPGPVNTIVVFQKGDTAGFTKIFGKGLRKQEKQGNYSISAVLEMLSAGPVAVINLRKFDDQLDTIQVAGMSSNKTLTEIGTVPYTSVFNTNGFWTPKPKNIPALMDNENLVNFANIGKGNVSVFVTLATNIESLTEEGDESLMNTQLTIDDYPALDANMKVKETFVDVWVFNNSFGAGSSTNPYFGHLFNDAGMVNFGNLTALTQVPEAGFSRKFTGSLIPFLKNERDEDVSIDTVVNNYYAETGVICHINDDILEQENIDGGLPVINFNGVGYYDEEAELVTVGNLLSHRLQQYNDIPVVTFPAANVEAVGDYTESPFIKFEGSIFGNFDNNGNKLVGVFENGVRTGDTIMYADTSDSDKVKEAKVTNVELGTQHTLNLAALVAPVVDYDTTSGQVTLELTSGSATGSTYSVYRKLSTDVNFLKIADIEVGDTYTDSGRTNGQTYYYYVLAENADFTSKHSVVTAVTVNDSQSIGAAPNGNNPVIVTKTRTYRDSVITLDRNITATGYYKRVAPVALASGVVAPTNLSGYISREAQFTNGSAARQREVLDVLNSSSVLKGLKNFDGIRYIIDVFKSFVEASYKYQFGQLAYDLDKCNKFVRCIINEPFIEDLEKSTNPLFRDAPNGSFNLAAYLPTGGNPTYSTAFLSKFTTGAEMCFFFGSGKVSGSNVYVQAPGISNKFIQKTYAWDVVANATGYIDNVSGIEMNPDDSERSAMEKFRWNPIIKKKDSFAIYGNFTGQKKTTALTQIHNSETLAYIKENLYNMAKDENFKKGLYNEYITFETAIQSFMQDLVLSGAIQPNPVVVCNFDNNTQEVQKALIKLVRIEYFNVNALDKTVFDLNLY